MDSRADRDAAQSPLPAAATAANFKMTLPYTYRSSGGRGQATRSSQLCALTV